MYRFEHPEYIWWLATILIATGIFLLYFRSRNKYLGTHFTAQNLRLTIPDYSAFKTLTKFILLAVVAALLIFTMANPLSGKKVDKQTTSKGSDIQFVVDVSNSMMCEDIKPNRLTKLKQIMLGIVDRLGSDRTGLIVFAGEAFVQLPMTIDQTAANMFIRNLSTDLVGRQGTSVEQALQTAIASIENSKAKYPNIVLISDGENLEGNTDQLIEELKDRKIPVHTIAIGTESGGPIPVYHGMVRTDYKKDSEGNVVVTKPDENFLKQLSAETGGIFIGTKDLGNAAESIVDELNNAEKEEKRALNFSDFNSLYLWFLVPSLILLILEFFLLDKRMKWQDLFRRFIERRSL